jgi:hypothetical protein
MPIPRGLGGEIWEARPVEYHEFLAYLYDRPYTRALAVALAGAVTTAQHLPKQAVPAQPAL